MTRRMHIEDLTRIAVPEQLTLSPDGQRIVYVLRSCDIDSDRNISRLWSVGFDSGDARQLTFGDNDDAPAWAPVGRTLAFLRAGDAHPQLWVLDDGASEPRQLTSLPMGAGTPVWSPDGTRIAFTAWADASVRDGEGDAEREIHASAPIVIDSLEYQADGRGLLGGAHRHLHMVVVATGETHQVTTGDWNAGDPAWSPDGSTLAFSANAAKDSDRTLQNSAYVINALDMRAKPRLVGLKAGSAGPLRWSADGDHLFVIGQNGPPAGIATLLRVAVQSGDVVDLARTLDRNVMPGGLAYPGARLQLVDDGQTVLFCVRDGGVSHLYSIPAAGGEPRRVLGGESRLVSSLAVAGQRVAIVLGTANSYGEVVTVDLESGAESLRTSHGSALAEVELFPREERTFTISDGTTVGAWIIHDAEQAGPRPLLLDVHGGPHNAWNGAADGIHLYHQELVARGWAVLLVNPRGSDGYGSEFFNGVTANWGEADSADLLEPIDALISEGFADPARLALAGYSYGGFMTCFLTSRHHRFAAAVAGGVVSDLVSMVGMCDDAHMLSQWELGGQFWEDRDNFARMSPLTHVENVTTPTLILHGSDDRVCPVGQAQQWFTALRERDVPTQMVLYPGGGHGFIMIGPPSQRIDFNRRIVEWVERFTSTHGTIVRPPIDAAHWQQRLDDLAKRHGVPGVQMGILRIGENGRDDIAMAATGSLNLSTRALATPDSVFQIGSISKVWTATVAMQLVDEGLIDLDAPIIDVLPELKLKDPDALARVSLRHLLTHTSGIDGDLFTDTGRGDDVLEKYVALMEGLEQIHPLGATWSYSNSGFVLIGRVIEAVTGKVWDVAMRERLFAPLGLDRTGTLAEEAILQAAAVGHEAAEDGSLKPVSVWALPRSLGPAGLITADVAGGLAFARMHLSGGLAADGTRVLSTSSTEMMAAHQTDLPDKHTLGDSWGLGWIRYLWDDHRVIGHDGTTLGQSAFLRLLPEQGLAIAIHCNGGQSRDLATDLLRELFLELADITTPEPLAPPEVPVTIDSSRHLGVYEGVSARVDLLEGPAGLVMRTTVLGPLAEVIPDPVEEFILIPVEENLYVAKPPGAANWMPVTFYALGSGQNYVHFGARATLKVG